MIATTAGTLPRSASVLRRPSRPPRAVSARAPDAADPMTALAHDALRDDARRLAALVRGLVSGRTTVDAARAAALGTRIDRLCHDVAPLLSSDDAVLAGDVRAVAAVVVQALQIRPLALATRDDFARLARCSALLDRLAAVLAHAGLAVPDEAVARHRAAETGRVPAGLDRRGLRRLRRLQARARRAERAVFG